MIPVTRRKKNSIFAIFMALFLIAGSFSLYFFVFTNGEPELNIIGDARAVSVTPVKALDGVLAYTNIFDALYSPMGIALLGSDLVVADSMADRIQILNTYESEIVGMPGRFGLSYGESGAFIDGFKEYAMFMKPSGVFVASNNSIIVSDTENHAIRQIIGEFVITIAGNGVAGYSNGYETDAMFNNPRAAVKNADGYIFVADTLNHVIRRINPDGYVELYAGLPHNSGFADGSLADARFFQPSGLYITESGVLYVADSANHAIRRIENGNVTTLAGAPGEAIRFSHYFEGGHVDGANSLARFNFPRDITRLPNGDLIIADSLNHVIRLITPTETRTIAGGGQAGNFRDSAENLQLTRPEGVTTDGETLFISDTVNNRVLSVPLTQRVLSGRPGRTQMLYDTGLTTNSRFAFRGDIRVFLGGDRVEMGRVQPWINGDSIFVPIRPFLEALGAEVVLDESSGNLYISIGGTVTVLAMDIDYFIMRGVMVTTLAELTRLFPYTIEWFPELSLITLHVPQDLAMEVF